MLQTQPSGGSKRNKRFPTETHIGARQIFLKTKLLLEKKTKKNKSYLKAANKGAHRPSEREASPRFAIDSLQPERGWKQAFSALQTNVKTINAGIEADHYLEMIKPLSGVSTAEQLLCQSVRAVHEKDCQAVPPADGAAQTWPFAKCAISAQFGNQTE